MTFQKVLSFKFCWLIVAPALLVSCGAMPERSTEGCVYGQTSQACIGASAIRPKVLVRPTLDNDYRGYIESGGASPEALIAQTKELCSSFGGFQGWETTSLKYETSGQRLAFSCSASSGKSKTAVMLPKAVGDVDESRKSKSPIEIERESLSFEDAKRKCLDLGFSEKTEALGKCVLQLSR